MGFSRLSSTAQYMVRRFGPQIKMTEVSKRLAQEANSMAKMPKMTEEEYYNQNVFSSFFEGEVKLLTIHENASPEEKYMREFWARYTKEPMIINPSIERAAGLAKAGDFSQRVVVDLGCGNTHLVGNLLKDDWKVHAVDSSPEALMNLCSTLKSQDIALSKIQAHLEKMEEFKFPKNVSLVAAQSSLPYCDPLRFQDLWRSIHGCLKPGGYFSGNLFVKDARSGEKRTRSIWYADMQMIKALIKESGYEKVALNQTSLFNKNKSSIDFILRKT